MQLPQFTSLQDALQYQQKVLNSLLTQNEKQQLLNKLDIVINQLTITYSPFVETSELTIGEIT